MIAKKLKARGTFGRAFAGRLKAARLRAGLTQGEVAALFDPPITRVAVAQWEDSARGTKPELERLLVMADAYGVTVDSLVTGHEGASPTPPHQPADSLGIPPGELADAWARLPKRKRAQYANAILIDAAILDALPELASAMRDATSEANPTFHRLLDRFQASRRQIGIELQREALALARERATVKPKGAKNVARRNKQETRGT